MQQKLVYVLCFSFGNIHPCGFVAPQRSYSPANNRTWRSYLLLPQTLLFSEGPAHQIVITTASSRLCSLVKDQFKRTAYLKKGTWMCISFCMSSFLNYSAKQMQETKQRCEERHQDSLVPILLHFLDQRGCTLKRISPLSSFPCAGGGPPWLLERCDEPIYNALAWRALEDLHLMLPLKLMLK